MNSVFMPYKFYYPCDMDTETIINTIIQCIYNVRGSLKEGFLESVYQKALLIELRSAGLDAVSEMPIKVYYRNELVGDFKADITIDNSVIIELKAVEILHKSHEAQLVNYLTATGIDNGILVNFGENFKIKRKYRVYRPSNS